MLFILFLFSRSCVLPCHSNLLLKAVAATQIRPNVPFGVIHVIPAIPTRPVRPKSGRKREGRHA